MENQNETPNDQWQGEHPLPKPAQCLIPPPGWTCTRAAPHKGPCAAVEATCGLPSTARFNGNGRVVHLCTEPWGHEGEMHGAGGAVFFVTQSNTAIHRSRQHMRAITLWKPGIPRPGVLTEAERLLVFPADEGSLAQGEHRLDQAALRKLAGQPGGGVDERRGHVVRHHPVQAVPTPATEAERALVLERRRCAVLAGACLVLLMACVALACGLARVW
jgi:hypothetical protein